MKSTILAKKLARRIEQEFNIEVKPIIHRTYVGYWQKKRGSWLWFMQGAVNGRDRDVGSCFKAKDVLKAKELSLYYSVTDQHEIMIER